MKKPVFKLASAIRLYQGRYDLLSLALERYTREREGLRLEGERNCRAMQTELLRLAGRPETEGSDMQRYHLMRLAGLLLEERTTTRLKALEQQINQARCELQNLKQRLRMLDLLREKQERDWKLEFDRQLEAEASYLHLIRNHSGQQL